MKYAIFSFFLLAMSLFSSWCAAINVAVMGIGYVGLTTAACLAEVGHPVICVDIDSVRVADLQQGIVPFYEPGLEDLVQQQRDAGRLSFTTDYQQAVSSAEVCFIAVDTPPRQDGNADLTNVCQVAASIAERMDHDLTIVNKSTVPVGTANIVKEVVSQVLERRGVDLAFGVVSNPEFLTEGRAIVNFLDPDRVVIGVDDPHSKAMMERVYSSFPPERLVFMDVLSAELTKYAANAMLVTRISFMNELAGLCERVGADIEQIREGIGRDRRIGFDFLAAGGGFGGSCFPKDISALYAQGKEVEYEMPLIKAAWDANLRQQRILGEKIEEYFLDKGGVAGKTVAIWGLAFKPETDDMREAPSRVLIEQLLQAGTDLCLYDPVAMDKAKTILGDKPVRWGTNPITTVQDADAVVLITEWDAFRQQDLTEIKRCMRGRAFFDGRNQFAPEEMQKIGFDYISIGRMPYYANPCD